MITIVLREIRKYDAPNTNRVPPRYENTRTRRNFVYGDYQVAAAVTIRYYTFLIQLFRRYKNEGTYLGNTLS